MQNGWRAENEAEAKLNRCHLLRIVARHTVYRRPFARDAAIEMCGRQVKTPIRIRTHAMCDRYMWHWPFVCQMQ